MSTVDEDGAGRPAKVDVSDLSEERSKTGNLNFIGLHNVVCWSKYTTAQISPIKQVLLVSPTTYCGSAKCDVSDLVIK